jgi:hypothetical protein
LASLRRQNKSVLQTLPIKSPKINAADFMMKKEKTLFKNFPGWQRGYGGFTYSFSARDNLTRYVVNQQQHHSKENFEEEYLRLLDEHGIEYDRKYLFI